MTSETEKKIGEGLTPEEFYNLELVWNKARPAYLTNIGSKLSDLKFNFDQYPGLERISFFWRKMRSCFIIRRDNMKVKDLLNDFTPPEDDKASSHELIGKILGFLDPSAYGLTITDEEFPRRQGTKEDPVKERTHGIQWYVNSINVISEVYDPKNVSEEMIVAKWKMIQECVPNRKVTYSLEVNHTVTWKESKMYGTP